jgi:FdhD protein
MVTRLGPGAEGAQVPADVVVEEPLEIRVGDVTVATTMRTPGHDFELAVGFCLSDGLLGERGVRRVRYCARGPAVDTEFNVVTVDPTSPPTDVTPRLTTVSSSCGVCGSDQIESLAARLTRLDTPTGSFDTAVLAGLADRVRARQPLFDSTGGSHAAAAFSLADGEVALVREDIGRHNAVDKVLGRLLLDDALPASDLGLWISGRTSFEMVQKCWSGGFPLIVSVSSPSAMAVSLAESAGMGLVGFARGDEAGVYSWPAGWGRT